MEPVRQNSVTYLSLSIKDNHVGVMGESPTVEIREMSTDRYFDFASDGTTPYWIDSGGRRAEPLLEKPWKAGLYSLEWDTSLYQLPADSTYAILFRNTSPKYTLDETGFIVITFSWADDVILTRKMTENKSVLTHVSENEATHEWYDDDGNTVLRKHRITVVGDTERRVKE